MIDVLWNIVSYTGLIALSLAIIGTCILFVCGIIIVIKSMKE